MKKNKTQKNDISIINNIVNDYCCKNLKRSNIELIQKDL